MFAFFDRDATSTVRYAQKHADKDTNLVLFFDSVILQQLIYRLSMRAACPAAGAKHTFAHFIETGGDAACSCFGFFRIFYPANPLVSGERRDAEPERFYFFVGRKSAVKIFR